MAHNLFYNTQTGQHSFFSVKEKAWHGLGRIIDQYPTSAEALKFAGLDYEVIKEDLYTTSFNSEGQAMDFSKRVKTHFATIRKDTGDILGIVGKDYQIVQNVEAFGFFDAIVGGDGIQYETAGALGNGERIFITAKLPNYIKVGKEDLIEQYLFLTTSHDGYGSITAAFTPIRVVCQNTLNSALKSHSNCIKIRHTTGAKERLEQAHKLMGITNTLSAQLETIFNRWSKVKISDPEVKKLIQQAMCPNKEVYSNLVAGKDDALSTAFKNICDNAFAYAMSNETQTMDTTRGTLFGAYNAVTGYFQNVRNYKNDEAKLKSLLYGGIAQQRTQKAFDLCTSFERGQFADVYN
jgi:phage/plasmid-like protein (TIGR03299 family)